MFKEINAKDIKDNFIKTIADEWALISAGTKDKYNMMTASWGFAGEMWGYDCIAAVIRPQRYTMELVDKNDYFTLSFYGNNKAIHKVCGSKSGRDTDKSEGFLCAWTEGGHALPYPQNALSVMEARVRSVTDAGDHRLFILEITEAATRLPKTEEGRLATEPSLLCLEHSVFACARQIS